MLYLLFSSIFLLPVFSGFGLIYEKLFGKIGSGLALKMLSGIFLITLGWTVFSFFAGLSLLVESITIMSGLFFFFFHQEYLEFYSFFEKHNKTFLLTIAFVLFGGTFFPFILDHFGYYLPTVQWISQYGLVKGISNLDLLLGQMSFWHIFQSGFSHFADPYLRVNSILLIIYAIYIFEKKSWIHLVFLPVFFLFSQSPSPDLPVLVFSLMVLDEVLRKNKNTFGLFALSVFVFAIKPTMIWLPLFLFIKIVFLEKWKFKTLLLGSILFGLFVFKNIWCFGFPVFPLQLGNLGISWQPNPEIMKLSSEIAIRKTFDMQYSYQEISKFTTFDYLKNWFFLKGIKSGIHLSFLLIIIVLGGYSLFKKNTLILGLFFAVLVKSILVVLFSAQYRFFIDVFFVVGFLLFQNSISRKSALIFFYMSASSVFLFLSFPAMIKKIVPSFKLGNFMTGFQISQFYEPAYFQWNRYHSYQVGNLNFHVVDQYPFSFDVPIPAISPEFLQQDLEAGIFPQQYSSNLKEGFFWRKMSAKEKSELELILNTWKKEYENKQRKSVQNP